MLFPFDLYLLIIPEICSFCEPVGAILLNDTEGLLLFIGIRFTIYKLSAHFWEKCGNIHLKISFDNRRILIKAVISSKR